MEWVKCSEQMPSPGVPVIAYVPTYCGGEYSRRIRAAYAPPKTLELHIDAEGGDYDEETDTYWCEEGWYEQNEYEECHWRVSDEVTHWMPLPPEPSNEEVSGAGTASAGLPGSAATDGGDDGDMG